MANINQIAGLLSPAYPWVSQFAVPFDDSARRFLTPDVVSGPNPYDSRQLQQWLPDLTQALDRCIAYRDQAAALESDAVRQAIDLTLARRLAEPHWFGRLLRSLFPAFFHQRWLREAAAQTLAEIQSSPDCSLNYGRRLEWLLEYSLKPDLQVAYQKARAVADGLYTIYSAVPPPLPDPQHPNILDNLLQWTRAASAQLDALSVGEVEFEHIVHVRDLIENKSVYDAAMDSGGTGLLSIDLSDYFTPTLQRIRLQGIGVSYAVNDDRQTGWWRLQQIAVVIFPPFQSDPCITPVVLSNVSITDPSQPVLLVNPPAIANLDPRGPWHIRISPRMRFAHLDSHPRTEGNIRDVRLHLSLRAKIDCQSNDWSDFNW